MAKKWILPAENRRHVTRLTERLRIGEVTARMLANRGLTDVRVAQQFLQPTLHQLRDPCEDPAVRETAAFLMDAIRQSKRITVFGDYDADGICAAAVLMRALRFLDADADIYIPHRIEEGYGLSCDALRELADAGTDVVVTVDCGISAAREVALAHELGLKVVVTDHHEPRDSRPEVPHLLNPKLEQCCFGYEYLAGVGVAFKLVWALGQQLSDQEKVSEEFKDLLMEALALVAIGTVADVVPLVDENRILVHYGLKTIAGADRPGLAALLETARVNSSYVSASDIAFRVAPLLNAAGRMGEPDVAVELLTTWDSGRAAELAAELSRQNRRRRRVQNAACREAVQVVRATDGLGESNCIVLSSPDWHRGIVGLVASRVAETFWRPTFVLTTDGDTAQGSARSIGGFPLYSAVERCADLLDRFGGHEGAAGVTMPVRNLEEFRERINEVAAELTPTEAPTPELPLDGEFQLSQLSLELLRELDLLAPFGKANPPPMFAASGLRVVGNPRTVGRDNRHLAFMVRQDNTTLRAFGAGKAEWLDHFRARKGEAFSLAFEPNINRYGGTPKVEMRVEDLQWEEERLVERRPSAR